MTHPEFQLATIVSSPFEENSYILHLKGREDCLVIDPGTEPDRLTKFLDQHHLTPAAILITHGHSDHIAGTGHLKERWPDCPLVIGSSDAPKMTNPWLNLSAQFGVPLVCPPADVLVEDTQVYTAAGIELVVRVIPGHSAGHVVYLWQAPDPYLVFVGDVIFNGSVGRSDFPDGNFDDLKTGIQDRLFDLPDSTILYSGHGPSTTIGRERRFNPFVGGIDR